MCWRVLITAPACIFSWQKYPIRVKRLINVDTILFCGFVSKITELFIAGHAFIFIIALQIYGTIQNCHTASTDSGQKTLNEFNKFMYKWNTGEKSGAQLFFLVVDFACTMFLFFHFCFFFCSVASVSSLIRPISVRNGVWVVAAGPPWRCPNTKWPRWYQPTQKNIMFIRYSIRYGCAVT